MARNWSRSLRFHEARAAYLRGDLTIVAYERVLDVLYGLADGEIVTVAADGPEWIIPTSTAKQ